jgi:hypothetical protein
VATALRRLVDRRLPGAVGHRLARRAGARSRSRDRRGEAARRQADEEPAGLRGLPQGRGGRERPHEKRSADPAQGARFLRRGGRPGPRLRGGVGPHRDRERAAVHQQHAGAGDLGACPAGGGEGDRAGAERSLALRSHGDLQEARPRRLPGRAGGVRPGPRRRAREFRADPRHGNRRGRARQLGRRAGPVPGGRAARPPIHLRPPLDGKDAAGITAVSGGPTGHRRRAGARRSSWRISRITRISGGS